MLSPETCRECGRDILVCRVVPDRDARKATGIDAQRWNQDTDQWEFVGWICWQCADDAYREQQAALCGCALHKTPTLLYEV